MAGRRTEGDRSKGPAGYVRARPEPQRWPRDSAAALLSRCSPSLRLSPNRNPLRGPGAQLSEPGAGKPGSQEPRS